MKKTLLVLALLFGVCSCHTPNKCCNDTDNKFNTRRRVCLDGTSMNTDVCKAVYEFPAYDTEVTMVIDSNHGLVINKEDAILPNRYCYGYSNDSAQVVYVICLDEDYVKEDNSNFVLANTIFQFTSVVFIAITVAVYLSLPAVRDLQGIIVIHSISGLGLGYILLGLLQFITAIDDKLCQALAYLVYYTLLYAFFWLNVLCFHIWKEVVKPKLLRSISYWKIIYHLYGIGGPLILLFLVVIANHAELEFLDKIHPRIGEGKCWFRSLRLTFIYFYGPIALLLTVNIIYFVWTSISLWQQCRNTQMKVLKYRFRLYVKLFLVMGLTWIFEVISAAFSDHENVSKWIWVVTDAFNALEGVIIFLVLVVFRKRVKRALANKEICVGRVRFPAQWKTEVDSECDPIEEEISLAA